MSIGCALVKICHNIDPTVSVAYILFSKYKLHYLCAFSDMFIDGY